MTGLKTVKTYEVYTNSGEEWVLDDRLYPARIVDPVWPEMPTAELEVSLGGFGVDEWRMEDVAGKYPHGMGIIVKEADVEEGDGKIIFWGVVSGHLLDWGPDVETARLASISAACTLAEAGIQGAWSRAYEDWSGQEPIATAVTHFGGLRPIFNADGRRNASVVQYKFGGVDVCSVFSSPDLPAQSGFWSAKKIMKYLFHFAADPADGGVTQVDFPALSGEGDLDNFPNDVDVEGKSWWQAIGEVLERSLWRCRIKTGGTGTTPTLTLAAWKVGKGTPRTVQLGAAGGNLSDADNAQQGHLAIDASGVVTLPLVYGGQTIYEGCFPLVPGWRQADMDTACYPCWSDRCLEQIDCPQWKAQTAPTSYYSRYVEDERALDHFAYRDVGRKWVLNEAGDYNDGNYGDPAIFDFAVAFDQVDEGLWIRRRRRFLAPISRDGALRHLRAKIELSLDGGSYWMHLADAEVLEEECGIRITIRDLAKIENRSEAGGMNYWDQLRDDIDNSHSNVQVRISASVADDSAIAPDPALSVPAWSKVIRQVDRCYDRRSEYQCRKSAPEPYVSQLWTGYADTADDHAKLTYEAKKIQDIAACLSARGSVVMPGLEWPHEPGDVVTKVAGREISFEGGGAEGSEVYAECVRVTRVFGKSCATEVVLEDPRMRSIR
jgi:hypothetical protein